MNIIRHLKYPKVIHMDGPSLSIVIMPRCGWIMKRELLKINENPKTMACGHDPNPRNPTISSLVSIRCREMSSDQTFSKPLHHVVGSCFVLTFLHKRSKTVVPRNMTIAFEVLFDPLSTIQLERIACVNKFQSSFDSCKKTRL